MQLGYQAAKDMAIADEMANPYTSVTLLKYNQNREDYVFLKISQVFV